MTLHAQLHARLGTRKVIGGAMVPALDCLQYGGAAAAQFLRICCKAHTLLPGAVVYLSIFASARFATVLR